MSLTKPYQEFLFATLQDPREAAEYLLAAWEDGDPEVFALAVQDVIEARGETQESANTLMKIVILEELRPALKKMGLTLAAAIT